MIRYISITNENENVFDRAMWFMEKSASDCPYFKVKVTILKHEKRYGYERHLSAIRHRYKKIKKVFIELIEAFYK